MAKKKTGGVNAQHKGRAGKRLGIKNYASELVKAGQILVRQRGTKIKAGKGVGVGKDSTLYALKEGRVVFKKLHGRKLILVE
jgi:large subunit ribosomal protein L27